MELILEAIFQVLCWTRTLSRNYDCWVNNVVITANSNTSITNLHYGVGYEISIGSYAIDLFCNAGTISGGSGEDSNIKSMGAGLVTYF